jgi:hypothetical protein
MIKKSDFISYWYKNGNADYDALIKYIPILVWWIGSAANRDLNLRARMINVYGIGLVMGGSIQNKYITTQL